MWLTRSIEEQTRRQRSAEDATVTSSSGSAIDALGTKLHGELPSVAPFGIACVPPDGTQAIVMPVSDGSVALGILMQDCKELSPGEIMLYSAGGARLILKNDGTIVANGKVIA